MSAEQKWTYRQNRCPRCARVRVWAGIDVCEKCYWDQRNNAFLRDTYPEWCDEFGYPIRELWDKLMDERVR